MSKNILRLIFCIFFLFQSAQAHSYNINPKAISISGVSSGAFMAVQMQVAYSKTFSGAASIAGGVYWCSQGDPLRAQKECMEKMAPISIEEQVAQVRKLSSAGYIDSLENLHEHRAYIFASEKDSVIHSSNSDRLENFYKVFLKKDHIFQEKKILSAHGFPTEKNGNPCSLGFLPWILQCNFDIAGEILKTFYGVLQPKVPMIAANLIQFSQKEFGDEKTPLYKEAWIYVPTACAKGEQCSLHVALHGCQMNPAFIKDKFPLMAGYNEWAESNKIIILYPQSAAVEKINPFACWDWFGFTGTEYATKSGSQMYAIKKMIEHFSK